MEQAAKQAQQQQVSPNQQQAAQRRSKSAAQAQQKQKQAELGLQMMLIRCARPSGGSWSNWQGIGQVQELIANLIRRQAGHNVDNLAIQDTDPAKKLITDDLLAKAERLRDKMPPKPDCGIAGEFPDHHEKNTRDVSKTGRRDAQGRSGYCRDADQGRGLHGTGHRQHQGDEAADAYDPSQVKALTSLEEAKWKTDAILTRSTSRWRMRTKETIRAAYEKIKAEQELINTETTKIDASPRLPDGTFRREVAVNLGKLPGQQGGWRIGRRSWKKISQPSAESSMSGEQGHRSIDERGEGDWPSRPRQADAGRKIFFQLLRPIRQAACWPGSLPRFTATSRRKVPSGRRGDASILVVSV